MILDLTELKLAYNFNDMYRTLSKIMNPFIGLEIGEWHPSRPIQKYSKLNTSQSSSNELNAAYAADGYARVHTKSVGALVTTCVLELTFVQAVPLTCASLALASVN